MEHPIISIDQIPGDPRLSELRRHANAIGLDVQLVIVAPNVETVTEEESKH